MYLTFFLGFFTGCALSFLFFLLFIRWVYRHKAMLTKLIKEIYHIDLLPFISRIEGLLALVVMEKYNSGMMLTYAEIALKEIRTLKAQVLEAVKRYENYQ